MRSRVATPGLSPASSGAPRRVADLLPRANNRADWRPVRALFHQQIQLAEDGRRRIPDELGEAFTDAMVKISASYAGAEAELCQDALAVLADVEDEEVLDVDLFRRYYEDERFSRFFELTPVRRRPSIFEAIVETCRRLRDARSLRVVGGNYSSSGLLVGSTSYGRFYNVCGTRHGHAASDLDFIVVAERASALFGMAETLAVQPSVDAVDVDHLVRRAQVFADRLDDGRTVFSHKIRMWATGCADPMLPSEVAPVDYLLSLHVMTPPVLDYLLVTSTPRLLKEEAGSRRTLRDYREAPASRWDDLFDFAGRRHRADLGSVPFDLGFLRSSRVYYIDNADCYFPGFYQTMFLPRPDSLWDNLGVGPVIDGFYRKLGERVWYEAKQRGHAMLRPSFAHVRREVFNPSVIKLMDVASSRW